MNSILLQSIRLLYRNNQLHHCICQYSGCLFYISFYCEIHQQPLNQDGTIDISKQKIYKIYLEPIDLSIYQITLTLLSDSIVLVADDKGHLIVSRIRDNCKAAKLYLCNQYLRPQYTFNKAFVVIADSNSKKVALIDISRGKLIRSKYNANQYLHVYGYHQKDSYYLSFESLKIANKSIIIRFLQGITARVNTKKVVEF
ncbi:unnamed protein product [Paramecium octaurelia]|uniref:Uncharacterized protein n=1 Tax=Paramecium octaurelia TaxID=43137 RepID=A0A8S1WRZ0_PAROT|nr:unnamed protein product [Paramecium octaurelia]